MGEPTSPISLSELEILKALWKQGPGTVRQINERLRRPRRRWAYTTVLTLLQRMEAKGYVVSDRSGVAHVFRSLVSREQLLRSRLKDLAKQLCEGGTAPLVLALVEGQRYTVEEIEQFRRLLDELEPKPAKR